ncbi:MAG: hypothetical protein OEU94_02080 [Aquincola sp.]|jgi:hypothetical protein|nr:hypothetical protein [Aquincola sp.]MDH4287713.1 hypothetical protein [Aquincola sp.]MDH5331423.1 hypothetical protein [Aquincola sp.]
MVMRWTPFELWDVVPLSELAPIPLLPLTGFSLEELVDRLPTTIF